MPLLPLGTKVFIEEEKRNEIAGGIYIPEDNAQKHLYGKVAFIGKGVKNNIGFKNGDSVSFLRIGSIRVTYDGKKYYVVEASDVFGIVT